MASKAGVWVADFRSWDGRLDEVNPWLGCFTELAAFFLGGVRLG